MPEFTGTLTGVPEEVARLMETLSRTQDLANLAVAELASLRRLKAILEDYSDTIDGDDGQPEPNMAMGILSEWEMREHYDYPQKQRGGA